MTAKERVLQKYPKATAYILLSLRGWQIYPDDYESSEAISGIEQSEKEAWQSAADKLNERVK